MTSATLQPAPATAAPHARPTGQLALALQEAFTVVVRLRANRQVAADAESFRTHVKHLLATADHESRQAGYGGEHVKLAVYAYVAFLDESILNSQQAMFSGWPRQPLQEEIFGDHVAGETFFRHLDELLGAEDAPELADVLEVYLLCVLLGFRGRYALGDPAGLQGRIVAAQQKLQRVRGASGDLAPGWAPPAHEAVPAARDPWIVRLAAFAGVALALALVLYVWFRLQLAPDVEAVRALAEGLAP